MLFKQIPLQCFCICVNHQCKGTPKMTETAFIFGFRPKIPSRAWQVLTLVRPFSVQCSMRQCSIPVEYATSTHSEHNFHSLSRTVVHDLKAAKSWLQISWCYKRANGHHSSGNSALFYQVGLIQSKLLDCNGSWALGQGHILVLQGKAGPHEHLWFQLLGSKPIEIHIQAIPLLWACVCTVSVDVGIW